MQPSKPNRISIKNGQVFTAGQGFAQRDVFIENDAIVAVGTAPAHFDAQEVIDAAGQLVLPGLIDLSAFLAEPGYGHKGNIASETKAASRSGITTLCCTPDTKPVIDSPAVANLIKEKNRAAGHCHVLPIGALTQNLEGEQLANMYGLKDAGCIALSNLLRPMANARVARQCFRYAATYDILVFINAQDYALADGGCMHEGATSTRMGLSGIPESAETLAIAQYLLLIEDTGVKAHFSQITTARGLQMIREARQRGLKVSADVALANLCFQASDVNGYNSMMHVQPPLRSEADRAALLAGVNEGLLAICSHHRPHEVAAKMAPFAASESGMSTLDTFSAVIFTLIARGDLQRDAAIAAVTSLPAAILGLEAGAVNNGGSADICIFNPEEKWQVSAQDLQSKGKNNPWLGDTLSGRVSHTLCAGRLVYSR